MNRWILGVIAIAISAIMAVGCGGGDDSTTALTKAEFTKQASAICTEGKQEFDAAIADYNKTVESTPGGTSDAGFQRDAANEMLNGSILPSMQEELEQLEELGAPAGDEADVSKMVKTLSQTIEGLEGKGIRELLYSEKYGRFQQEAEAYGLECSA